jgi:hypothetical protein
MKAALPHAKWFPLDVTQECLFTLKPEKILPLKFGKDIATYRIFVKVLFPG